MTAKKEEGWEEENWWEREEKDGQTGGHLKRGRKDAHEELTRAS